MLLGKRLPSKYCSACRRARIVGRYGRKIHSGLPCKGQEVGKRCRLGAVKAASCVGGVAPTERG